MPTTHGLVQGETTAERGDGRCSKGGESRRTAGGAQTAARKDGEYPSQQPNP